MLQLEPAPGTGRCDRAALVRRPRRILEDQYVPRIFTLGDRGDGESGGDRGRQILQAVNREQNLPLDQRLLQFLREQTLGAAFGERSRLHLVAGRLDDLQIERKLWMRDAQAAEDLPGLGEGKGAPARSNQACILHGESGVRPSFNSAAF